MSGGNRLYNVALGGCLVGFIFLGLVWPLLAQEAKGPSETAPQAEQPSTEKSEPEELPPSVPPEQEEPPPAVENKSGQDADYYADADLTAQQRMAVGTEDLVKLTDRQNVITAVEAGLLVLAILFSAWASIAASRAAKAADKAVEITSQTAKHQLRAYVAQEIIVWAPLKQPGTKTITGYNLTIRWKNCGLTPARRCRTRFNIGVFKNSIPKDFAYPDPSTGKELPVTEKSHIGPNGTISNTVGITVAEAQAVQSGKVKIFAWGWTEYDDIFEGTPRRRTEVCIDAVISPDGHSFTGTIIGPFNGADEDCHHKPKT